MGKGLIVFLLAGMLMTAYDAPYSTDNQVSLAGKEYSRVDAEAGADISIEYVQVGRLPDRNAEGTVNEMLRQEAFSDWQPDSERDLSLKIVQTPIIYRNYLSVTTWTDCYIRSAVHPWCSLSSMVIDTNTGQLAELGDLMTVDEQIIEKINEGVFKNDRFSHEECLKMKWYDQLGDSILNRAERTGGFYLKEKGIVFIIDVSHVEGDYLTFEAAYDELGGLCKID